MAANYYDWSVIAANNGNSDADSTWAEGQAPSTVNNTGRSDRARVRQFITDLGGSIAAGGTANGLTVTANAAFTAYADGQIIAFRATAKNTGAATLSVNGIGAKAIRKMGVTADVALDAGDIVNTGIYVALYSTALNGAAGAWLLINATKAEKAPTLQVFINSGTWTNPGCRMAIFEAAGGGGAGGGVPSTLGGLASAGGGGGSGFYAKTGLLDVSATVSAAVTIGNGGTGVSGAAGNAGTATTITINATAYSWGGGGGGFASAANAGVNSSTLPGGGGAGTNLSNGGWGQRGDIGKSNATDADSIGGGGGSTTLGSGGYPTGIFISGSSAGGQAGFVYGGGGAGAAGCGSSTARAGGAGAKGVMLVWEFY